MYYPFAKLPPPLSNLISEVVIVIRDSNGAPG
jgi:hypothetical protein